MFRLFRRKPAAPAPAPAALRDEDQEAFDAADALQDGRSRPGSDDGGAFSPQREPIASIEAPSSDAPMLATPPPSPTGGAEPVEPTPTPPDRRGWFTRLREGLRKTGSNLSAVFGDALIDDALYEDLETALLMADTGTAATALLLDELRERVQRTRAVDAASVRVLLIDSLAKLLQPLEGTFDVGLHPTTVVMVAGVNGAGKTTSIGKLTKHLSKADCKVLLAAADTFRAAAKEQLEVWADRNQVRIVSQAGGDPAAVAFDAVKAGQARGCDVVIVDTAGRLATQAHLMDELRKIRRTVGKALDGAPHETLLVVDGNTGQNALAQAKAFDEAIELTGLVVTKLDGTAKGGVLAAIALWVRERAKVHPHKRPIRVYFIGVGEALEDLERFDAREFARALLE
jgi:fused signal recognition particle receptor